MREHKGETALSLLRSLLRSSEKQILMYPYHLHLNRKAALLERPLLKSIFLKVDVVFLSVGA